ncbi:SDR family NAD(P)-dependent oxidoreductase [Anabaena sp. FACHB-1237]|uniref:type I polyketide synthase n=1 Tax=Anabaena sp. FACHB-1237 TaxID=2692769 RepID=UPI00168017BD|nr:type I polyketide synthase [Anabaena sp. FACHB-1237]MBD2136213.1 SDR family NAD(P)-dependent oxidoreductase [Anabaena sp. FACHB-1237]
MLNNNLQNTTDSQRILKALQQARTQVENAERQKSEPIAIVGMGFRFPGGAKDADSFWHLLENGIDAITEIPPQRWDVDAYYDPNPDAPGKMYTRYGGFIDAVEQFDPQFFGIAPREAMEMDPQQRLLLEVTWEAIENAGFSADKLKGTSTGVFIGMSADDYAHLCINFDTLEQVDAYTGFGNARSIGVGRLAYTLGLQGVTVQLDTSCSSSLLGIHLACQSLRSRECNLALAGGVNLMLSPIGTILFSKSKALSPDGRCKTFDASADGYARGEGCGIVVLKRLSDAIADNDHILAVIRGSAANHDGKSNGLTAPNGSAQEAVIRQAVINAKLKPEQIQYVEAHGTGTPLGDPIEVSALGRVLGENRHNETPLIVGSLKTNFGHLEAAVGVASLIKVVLAMQHEQIPPHLHFKTPNPYIAWDKLAVKVPTELTPWPEKDGQKLAGISCFGMSGTNVHLILESAPSVEKYINSEISQTSGHLLALSGKTEQALQDVAKRYIQLLEKQPEISVSKLCFTANSGRSHFDHRLAIITESCKNLHQQLQNFLDKNTDTNIVSNQLTSKKAPKISYLCSGQGSQYIGMGRELYNTEPIFKQNLDKCREILFEYIETDIIEIIHTENDLLDQTAYTQPALFAIEYSLYKTWEHYGIKPDIVLGHSIGEYPAACIAGIFSLEDGLKLIAHRGKLMQKLPKNGKMVAVQTTAEKIEPLINQHSEQEIAIAAYNGTNSIVISGNSTIVDKIVKQLEKQNIKTKQLQVSHAFHSPLMQPILDEYRQIANQVNYNSPKIPIISNLTGEIAENNITTAEYWVNHIIKPVKFAQSIQTLQKLGYTTHLEIGPKPVLLGMASQIIEDNNDNHTWLPSLRPGTTERKQILQNLASLYTQGADIKWENIYSQPQHKIQLPTYPFQRQSYWVETKTNKTNINTTNKNQHPLLGNQLNLPFSSQTRYENQLTTNNPPHQEHHRIFNINILAAASHVSLTLQAVKHTFKTTKCTLEQVFFQKPLIIAEDKHKTIQIIIEPENNHQHKFQIISPETTNHWIQHVNGKITLDNSKQIEKIDKQQIINIQKRCAQQIKGKEHYQQFTDAGYTLGTAFQWIETAWSNTQEALGKLSLPELPDSPQQYQLYPGLIDSCFQVLGMCQATSNQKDKLDKDNYIYIPFHIEKFSFYQTPNLTNNYEIWCHAEIINSAQENNENSSISGNITIFDNQGEIIAKITNFQARKASKEALKTILQGTLRDWYYQIEWQKSDVVNKRQLSEKQTLLIFASANKADKEIITALENAGYHTIIIQPGTKYKKVDSQHYQIAVNKPEEYGKVFTEITANNTINDIIHLWSLNTKISDVITSQEMTCGTVLNLLQTLIKIGNKKKQPQLYLVTENAQKIGDEKIEIQVQQAPLWNLGKVIALEHPEYQCRCVDITSEMTAVEKGNVLLEVLLSNDKENLIAYRQNERYVMRLTTAKLAENTKTIKINAEGSYLITGGLGALGLEIARWLVSKGARNIVLMGRNAPQAKAQRVITELEGSGVNVSVYLGDVGIREDVENVINQIETDVPLRGVIHAAGVLDDGMLSDMSWDRFSKVLQPKVDGTWYLHDCTRHLDVELFVCFSSIASLLGSAGQGNYAVANGFMDALMSYRESQGLPGLSVSWGPWAEGGMAASLGEQYLTRLQAQGLASIPVNLGFRALDELMNTNHHQIGVFSLDWERFSQQLSPDATMGLLDNFISAISSQNVVESQQSSLFIKKLEDAPIRARKDLLLSHIRGHIAKILGMKIPEQISLRERLFDLGIDSLMAVELKNILQSSLGCSVRSTMLFDYPTLEALVNYLIEDVLEIDFYETVIEEISEVPATDDLDDMTDDELAMLLSSKLTSFNN